MWAVRELAAVRRFYEAYYGEKDLVTSFDGCSVLRGGEHHQQFSKSWLHVDRSLMRTPDAFGSVQAAVNLVAGAPQTHGGFVCVPRSHHEYDRLAKSRDVATWNLMKARPKEHYLRIPSDHPIVSGAIDPETKRVKCIALRVHQGDMVTWQSSLVHANTGPSARRGGVIQECLRRLTPFVAMLPRVVALEAYGKSAVEWNAAREAACKAAATAGHDPSNPLERNRPGRPRHASFKPITTPADCVKITFTPSQRALL
jgi:hypothetical protein